MHGQYETLMQELMQECHGDFKSFLRMEVEMFMELLHRVAPVIAKNMRYREPLDPGLKLAITLRYLATGNSFHSLAFAFRVAHNTISLFVPEVCDAIVQMYQPEVIRPPTNPQEWQAIADSFSYRWNFHHTCGALDGKHVRIKKPRKSGSLYYNYKGFFSIVLLALVDADYKFIWANVGSYGSESDCGIFNQTDLRRRLEDGTLGLPAPAPFPHDDEDIPYFLIGDDAFPLRPWMIKPYAHRFLDHDERIFNYRCSRARRVVENAFGILANRFRVLLSTIETQPANATRTTKASVCLHNLMRLRYPGLQNADLDREDDNGNIIPGAWRVQAVWEEVEQEGRAPRETRDGKMQRAYMKHYYCSEVGSVPWQEDAIM